MVELPDVLQRRRGEIIIGIQRLRGPAGSGAGIGDFLYRLPEDRITEPVPGNGNEDGNPPDGAAVLEDDREPPAVRRIDNAALGRAAVQVVQVTVIHVSAGPYTGQVIRDKAGLGPVPFPLAGVDQEKDIFPVDLIQVGAFISQEIPGSIPDNDPVQAAFLRAAQVFLQLRETDIPVAVNDIDTAVIVEQQGAVVVDAFDILFGPGTFDALRGEEKSFRPFMRDEGGVETAGVIPQGSGPHAVAVNGLFILQDFAGGMLQGIIDIGADLPVDQVVGPENPGTGKEVHGCADHVVSVSDTDDVRIRIIHSGQGITAFRHCDRLHQAYSELLIPIMRTFARVVNDPLSETSLCQTHMTGKSSGKTKKRDSFLRESRGLNASDMNL